MTRQALNPDELFNSLQYGFSQITVGTGTKFVTVSGQVGWDKDGNIVGKDDLAVQTVKAFENLEIAMKAAGGTLDNILSLRIYIVQSVMSNPKAISDGLRQFFPDNPPTATWIGVPSLANEEFLVEIEAFAVLT
jgi:enamine deaminase RidA (YjgF/YER057c/UK114 family)